MMFDDSVTSGTAVHIASKKDIIDVFFEIVMNPFGKNFSHQQYLYVKDGKIFSYYYNGVSN
jgi:hypothetical protein